MVRSLQWRVQIWHAVVLTAVLSVFGVIVYHLQWQTRLSQIDTELDRTADVLTSRLRRLLPLWQWRGWHPPLERPDVLRERALAELNAEVAAVDWPPPRLLVPPMDPLEAEDDHDLEETTAPLHPWHALFLGKSAATTAPRPSGPWLPQEFTHLFEGEDTPWYYIVWNGYGEVLQRSEFAPKTPFPNLYRLESALPVRIARMRGMQREVVHVTNQGNHVLVGRSIEWDLASQHASGWFLAACGWVVLTIGLAGGWRLTGRAIRPIRSMSEIASTISGKNLSQRIDLEETDSELGQLAKVLNQTFDRLEAAFEHQARFTADASHELRTPLAVITSQTELALSKPRSSDEYRQALETCQRAALRMNALIESLLMLARFDTGNPDLNQQPLDLKEVAKESLDLLRPLAEARQITLHEKMESLPIFGDRTRLGQVFANLLSNAIRYNHEGGSVEVRTQRMNGDAVLSVTDSGIGIPPEALPHIFDRFYRVDGARSSASGGYGLGLAICQSVVAAHGGRIHAQSEPNRGTTIEVRLPLGPLVSGNSENP
jgi:heavy metal sensor kinase